MAGSGWDRLRQRLASPWLLAAFAAIYATSQAVIVTLVHPLGTAELLKLQVAGFTADAYRDTFARWDAAGVMPFYRAHLVFDDLHWLWYAGMLAALLALALEAARLPRRWTPVVVLPLIAGALDCVENGLQHVFLSDPRYATIVDPLPAISTLASIGKWSAIAVCFAAIGIWFTRARRSRG